MSIKPVLAVACSAIALALAGCSSTPSAESAVTTPALTAPLINGAGVTIGEVVLEQRAAGVQLSLRGSDLPPGAHGFHIHMAGKCDGPDFTSAGSHWNPGQQQHGHHNPQGAHAGDLPNLVVAADGTARFEQELAGVRLTDEPTPVLDSDGAAFVIHAAPDDEKTDPTGNSGARIACAAFAPR